MAQRIPAVGVPPVPRGQWGKAAVRVMKDEGVEVVFGCPGAALLPLCTAMAEAGGIERLSARHEEGATHMAHGWARTSGRPGVVAAPAGPGAARLLTGLYAAQQDAVPLVCIIGREPAGPRRTTGPLRPDTFRPPDLVRLAGPVTKRAERIEDPARIPGAFREAFHIAREGRPGPVLLDIPADLAATELADGSGRGPGFAFRPASAGPERGRAVPPHAPAGRAGPAGLDGACAPAPWPLAEIAEIFGTDAAPGTHLVGGAPGTCATAAVREGRRDRFHCHHGPPGWEVPAAIGIRTALDSRGEREAEVVVTVGSRGFPLLAEELASAVRHEVPFVLLLLPPGRPSGHQGRHPDDGPLDERLPDHVKLVEAYGCAGRDVVEPAELRSAVEWARKEAVSTRRPVLVEVRTERAGRVSDGAATGPVHRDTHGPRPVPVLTTHGT
ncbi:thiamine pyrophosphate-binding protein [Streptomyces caniferus]|uniref:thiamine pyrophosphate-binding protein n=1 Tax=Streptomyces caniferus TaxID=285557 RepID=UPI0034511AF4